MRTDFASAERHQTAEGMGGSRMSSGAAPVTIER